MSEDYIYHVLELLNRHRISIEQARKLIDIAVSLDLVKNTKRKEQHEGARS